MRRGAGGGIAFLGGPRPGGPKRAEAEENARGPRGMKRPLDMVDMVAW